MSQPPQGGQDPQSGQPPQGQGDSGPQGPAPQGPQGPGPQGPGPHGPGPQGYPPQPGGGQPPYPPQGYPPRQGQPPYPPQGYPQQPAYPPQPGYPGQQGYPPQPGYPPGQQGYPGQPPYAGGPGPQPPGYGTPPGGPSPYPPGPGQPGPGPRRRTGLFVLIGAGALALVLAVVAFAVNLGGRNDGAGGGTGGTGGGGTASSAPAAASAGDAVNGYLQAVAKGDVQTAVSYATDPSAVDTTYMTPAVLATSARLAPITDIKVGPSDPDATTVPATYRLGSSPVDTSFDVMKTSNDEWKLISVATVLDLTAVQDDAIPMLINGTKLKPGPFSVLPGQYRFTTGQRNFDYGSHPDLVVKSPSDFPDITRIQPRISSKGRASALSAVKRSWNSCLDKHAQRPKGCPNQFTYKDFNFRDSTVRWSRRGSDPFKKIKPSYVDATTVQYVVKRDLALKGTCTASGRTGACTGTLKGGTVQVEARLSGSKIKVEWLV
jgi:hypothetical protein